MTDVQAALGLSQLNRLKDIVKERNRQRLRYKSALEKLDLSILEIPDGVISSVHLVVISLINKDQDYHRELFTNMRAKGVGVQLHYTPVHLQPYYKNLGFKDGDFPLAELYATSSFSLPVYPGLHDDELDYVVDCLHTTMGNLSS